MEGFGYKKYVTVVMDGSDVGVVRHITDLFDMVTEENMYGFKATCGVLDNRHPTMMVIESRLPTEHDYRILQNNIEHLYPGLCVFNPPM